MFTSDEQPVPDLSRKHRSQFVEIRELYYPATPITVRPCACAPSASAVSCVAITRFSPVVSRHSKAVARWIASSVPSAGGIGCAARPSTAASTSTISSGAINARIFARREAKRTHRRTAGDLEFLSFRAVGLGKMVAQALACEAPGRKARDLNVKTCYARITGLRSRIFLILEGHTVVHCGCLGFRHLRISSDNRPRSILPRFTL
jgi:hypothetical protein